MASVQADDGGRDTTRYAALLRAVNVGGKNSVPMERLRAVLEERFADVSTLLQSGNVLLSSTESEPAISAGVSGAIASAFDLRIPVIVRSAAEIATIVSTNPFLALSAKPDVTTLHVAFLLERPRAADLQGLDPDGSPPDACRVSRRDVYLSYPNGSARTRLTLGYLERSLGVQGTARNWRTVLRIASLLDG